MSSVTVKALERADSKPGAATPLDTSLSKTKGSLDLEQEALLDPDFEPGPVLPLPSQGQRLLLTGATGFVGAYMLEALLRRTDAQLLCLLRGTDAPTVLLRLIDHLKNHGLWEESFRSRLEGIPGDLAAPGLGLDAITEDRLAREVDAIYHCGGWVNFVYPYEKLKPANVDGTRALIYLAGAHHAKPLHFLSTLAIFFTAGVDRHHPLTEEQGLTLDPDMKGGYRSSKWVADKLMQHAMARGLPVTLYRPVRVSGHSKTGQLGDSHDLFFSMLRACILLGVYPQLDIRVPMVPIDYVAQAVVHLSLQPDARGRAYHLICEKELPWEQLWETVNRQGYRVTPLPYDQWWKRLETVTTTPVERRFFMMVRLMLSAPNNLLFQRPPLDNRLTKAALEGSQLACPPADDTLMTTYLLYFQKTGYLPTPEAVGGVTG